MLDISFTINSDRIHFRRGLDEVDVPITQADLATAIYLLKQLNAIIFTNGLRVSENITIDGFSPHWFSQEHIFWYLLVPYTRYRELLKRIAAEKEDVLISGATAQFRAVVSMFPRGFFRHPIVFESAKGERKSSRLFAKLSLIAVDLLKLSVTAWALVAARFKRPEVLLYAIDKVSPGLKHDFRLDPVYKKLKAQGLGHIEYMHSAGTASEALRNMFLRGRPVVYFESVSAFCYSFVSRNMRKRTAIPDIPFEKEDIDSAFLAGVARYCLQLSRKSAAEIACLKWMIQWHRPKWACILDDSRHANELICACKEAGVFTLGFQHGLFNKYHPGLMAYGFGNGRPHTFDAYGLWSEYWRGRLLRSSEIYTEKNTFVFGPLRPPTKSELDAATRKTPSTGAIRILVVSEPRWIFEQVVPYVTTLAADARFAVTIKLRPGESAEKARVLWGDREAKMRFLATGTVFDAFKDTDVVLGTYSTVLYEAAMALVPAIVVKTDFTYGHEIVEDKLALYAESPSRIIETVLLAAQMPAQQRIYIRDTIWGHYGEDTVGELFRHCPFVANVSRPTLFSSQAV